MGIDGDKCINSPELYSSIIITPHNAHSPMKLNYVEDIPPTIPNRQRPMPKWDLSTLSHFSNFLSKCELFLLKFYLLYSISPSSTLTKTQILIIRKKIPLNGRSYGYQV
jgi:hypothetical protein